MMFSATLLSFLAILLFNRFIVESKSSIQSANKAPGLWFSFLLTTYEVLIKIFFVFSKILLQKCMRKITICLYRLSSKWIKYFFIFAQLRYRKSTINDFRDKIISLRVGHVFLINTAHFSFISLISRIDLKERTLKNTSMCSVTS